MGDLGEGEVSGASERPLRRTTDCTDFTEPPLRVLFPKRSYTLTSEVQTNSASDGGAEQLDDNIKA